jgi:hypothetical protein
MIILSSYICTNLIVLKVFTQAHALKKKEIVNNNKKIHFLICGSCFWCASHFNNIGDMIVKCPSCDSNNKVESIPVSYNEVYKLYYDPKRGVVLEFSKVDERRRRS